MEERRPGLAIQDGSPKILRLPLSLGHLGDALPEVVEDVLLVEGDLLVSVVLIEVPPALPDLLVMWAVLVLEFEGQFAVGGGPAAHSHADHGFGAG